MRRQLIILRRHAKRLQLSNWDRIRLVALRSKDPRSVLKNPCLGQLGACVTTTGSSSALP